MDTIATSPFLGSGYLSGNGGPASTPPVHRLLSPFSEALVEGVTATARDDRELLETRLQDESFDDALEALADEAAALHLTVPWASESDSGTATLEAWGGRLITEADRLLDGLAERFAERTVESITEGEIDSAAAELLTGDYSPASEQLFGGIVGKLKKVAKAGLNVLAKFTGLGQVTAILKKLVKPLIKRVVQTAIGKLPAALQGPARQLAQKLGADFDRQFAEALQAPDPATLENVVVNAEAAAEPSREDPIAELDAARERLTQQLLTAEPGEPPEVEVEQFIPAVMAAMPLVRTAVKVIGRDRIKRLIAKPVAFFISKLIGQQAARALAPHIADAGMRLLKLEHEDRALLGAEAMVATIEETVRQVLSLPAESLADDLRVGAEVQEAFAEAAADYLPGRMLRGDLETGDPQEANEGWIMMPRSARPHYRFRAHSRPYHVALDRACARAVVLDEDETLEDRLDEEGVAGWPAEVEVRLFEALPGTRYGHVDSGDFGELTPRNAGMLLGRAGLGHSRRFFQVVTPGRHQRRHRVRRFALGFDTTSLRVHLRLGERAGHTLAGLLNKNGHTQVVAMFRKLLGPGARQALAKRLTRLRGLNAPATLAGTLTEAMITAVAKELPSAAAALTAAAQDPAAGLTLTFTFPLPDPAGAPGTPALTVRPGAHRD